MNNRTLGMLLGGLGVGAGAAFAATRMWRNDTSQGRVGPSVIEDRSGGMYGQTQGNVPEPIGKEKHQVLRKPTSLESQLERMRRDPNYRPGDYAPGAAGIHQAEERLKDAKALYGDLQTEGDS